MQSDISWIIYGLLMFISSIVMNLALRAAKAQKINHAITLLAGFGFPAVVILVYLKLNNIAFNLTLDTIILIFLGAFAFSYLGNIFSLKAIQNAANPGFSFIIQKSYSAFTIFLAAILFNSPITLIKLIGVFIIIMFTGVIIIEPGKPFKFKDSKWLSYSLGAFLCFGCLSLFSKYILNQGVDVFVFLFLVCLADSIYFSIQILFGNGKVKFELSRKILLILLVLGISSLTFNMFTQLGFKFAPNVGYINALNTGSIAFVTLLSALIFKDELTRRKMVGVVGIIFGLILIFL